MGHPLPYGRKELESQEDQLKPPGFMRGKSRVQREGTSLNSGCPGGNSGASGTSLGNPWLNKPQPTEQDIRKSGGQVEPVLEPCNSHLEGGGQRSAHQGRRPSELQQTPASPPPAGPLLCLRPHKPPRGQGQDPPGRCRWNGCLCFSVNSISPLCLGCLGTQGYNFKILLIYTAAPGPSWWHM